MQHQNHRLAKTLPLDISVFTKPAERGNIEAVKQHLDTGEDVNVKSDSGMTPLHHAAYRENNEVIELLIAKGASVNAQDVAGRTPLNVAIRYNTNQKRQISSANTAARRVIG